MEIEDKKTTIVRGDLDDVFKANRVSKREWLGILLLLYRLSRFRCDRSPRDPEVKWGDPLSLIPLILGIFL